VREDKGLLCELPDEADKLTVYVLTKEAVWEEVCEIDLNGLREIYFFPFIIKFCFTGHRDQSNLIAPEGNFSETGQ